MPEDAAPLVIAIGGSDPGAGAGVQADTEMAARLGVDSVAVCTMHTEQDAGGLRAVDLVSASQLRNELGQLDAMAWSRPRATVKTGALGSAALVDEVLRFLDNHPELGCVVDPVRRASVARPGVAPLLDDAGWQRVANDLLPRALLVTPNFKEWSALEPEAWGVALRKGGHRFDESRVENADRTRKLAVDELFADGALVHRFQSDWIEGAQNLHGTGCRLATAIAAEFSRAGTIDASSPVHAMTPAIETARLALRVWMLQASS